MKKRLDLDEHNIKRSNVSAGKELLSSPLEAADSLMGLNESPDLRQCAVGVEIQANLKHN